MSKLTTKQRKAMPKSEFAGAGKSFPINDRAHAANAKARATQAVNAGRSQNLPKRRLTHAQIKF